MIDELKLILFLEIKKDKRPTIIMKTSTRSIYCRCVSCVFETLILFELGEDDSKSVTRYSY